jgi:hypothetical protein
MPPKPQTLSIEDAFSGLGLDGSAGGGIGASAGAGVSGASLQQQSDLPMFAAGEAVVYTDSQGNRARVTVVKVRNC